MIRSRTANGCVLIIERPKVIAADDSERNLKKNTYKKFNKINEKKIA